MDELEQLQREAAHQKTKEVLWGLTGAFEASYLVISIGEEKFFELRLKKNATVDMLKRVVKRAGLHTLPENKGKPDRLLVQTEKGFKIAIIDSNQRCMYFPHTKENKELIQETQGKQKKRTGKEFEIRQEEPIITIDFLKYVTRDLVQRAFEASGKYAVAPASINRIFNIFAKTNQTIPLASINLDGAECKSICLANTDNNKLIAKELEGMSEVSQVINTLVFNLCNCLKPTQEKNQQKTRLKQGVPHPGIITPLLQSSHNAELLRKNLEGIRAQMHKLSTPNYSPIKDELRLSLHKELSQGTVDTLLKGYSHERQQGAYHVKSGEGALIAAISPKKIVFYKAVYNTEYIKATIAKICENARRN